MGTPTYRQFERAVRSLRPAGRRHVGPDADLLDALVQALVGALLSPWNWAARHLPHRPRF